MHATQKLEDTWAAYMSALSVLRRHNPGRGAVPASNTRFWDAYNAMLDAQNAYAAAYMEHYGTDGLAD